MIKAISQFPSLKRTSQRKKNYQWRTISSAKSWPYSQKRRYYKVARLWRDKGSVRANQRDKEKAMHIDLTFVVKIPNSLSFENGILTLIKKTDRNVYRYINTDTNNIYLISFENFQKLLLKQDLTWSNMNLFIA